MTTEDMTYYLVISHKFLKPTGKYALSVQKIIIYCKTLYKTYIDEVNYNRKGRFLVLHMQLH